MSSKNKHIQTDFIKFILEKYSNPEDEFEEDNESEEEEIQDEDEPTPKKKQSQSQYEEDEVLDEDDELEKLITEYQKTRKKYESIKSNRIHNKGKY